MYSELRKKMRSLFSQQRCTVAASVYDPVSARLAQDLEFDLGIMAGSVASMAITGAPDLAVVTLTELAEQVRRTCRAASLPVLIDADHGFGNALHVMRTVEEIEAAGAAAVSIEDTLLPGVYGDGKPGLISLEEMVGKLKAALAARRDPDFMIVARTSCVAIAGIEETLKRVEVYDKLGVDILMLVGVESREQLEAITACTDLPIILGGCAPETTEIEYATSQQVKMVVLGIQPYLAGIQGACSALSALRQGNKPDPETLATSDLVRRVSRAGDYNKWQENFLAHKGANVTWDWAK